MFLELECGGGLLFLRHVTPLTRRDVVYLLRRSYLPIPTAFRSLVVRIPATVDGVRMRRHYALVLGPSEIFRAEKGDRSWAPGAVARMAEQSVLRTSGFTTVEAESRETGFPVSCFGLTPSGWGF
jgi:hypothetical protein